MNPEEQPAVNQTEPTGQDKLSQIRTYQGDVASAISDQQESITSIQQREVAKQRGNNTGEKVEHGGREKVILLVLGSIVLVILGMFGGWYTYQEFIAQRAPSVSPIPESRLFSTTQEAVINVASTTLRADLIRLVRVETDTVIQKGESKHIVLEESFALETNLVTTQTFLKILETKASGPLVRSFDKTFMLGALGGETPSNFIIIKLSSFESAYAGMLSWEENLPRDLGPLFQTSEEIRNIPSPSSFSDTISRNKDIRSLLNAEGKTLLLYSFLDNKTLIITDSLDTLHVIISRLTAESLTR